MSELDKWADAQPSMAVLREFLEWCDGQKIALAKARPSGTWYLPLLEDREALLARYFKVNTVKLENERRALLRRASTRTA